MKPLRSPWVSGALAVLAVAVVAHQFLPALWPKRAPRIVAPPPAAVAPAVPPPITPAQAETATAQPTNLPPVAIECTMLESCLARWAEAPNRDPFRLQPVVTEPAVHKAAHKYPSPVLFWKLNGIWRQTEGRVAAINNRIYTEGETIQGYRLLKIDVDQVVFEGPDGPEVLALSAPTAKPAKKQ